MLFHQACAGPLRRLEASVQQSSGESAQSSWPGREALLPAAPAKDAQSYEASNRNRQRAGPSSAQLRCRVGKVDSSWKGGMEVDSPTGNTRSATAPAGLYALGVLAKDNMFAG